MKDRPFEETPAAVTERSKQAGENRDKWSWVERTIWTERMLTALEKGVKGGKWFSLIDKVHRPETLLTAFRKIKENKGAAGVDCQTIEMFEKQLEDNLDRLSKELRKGTYSPKAIKRVYIPKPGSSEKRPLGIPTIRDRIVQAGLRFALEPIFEKDFAEHSYGFRPERGCKDALRRVETLLKEGTTWVVDADLKSYFDSIPHETLLEDIRKKVSDGRVLALIKAFLKQEILETNKTWTPEEGTPQGAVLSPLLSNIYLDPLDHEMSVRGYEMVRYADDFVVLCRSEEEAYQALEAVREWTKARGLTLHPVKTKVVDATQRGGFDFLGYHFERGLRWPRKKSHKNLRDSIRNKTKRANGHSMELIISRVNRTLRGWYEYYKHSHKLTFPNIDSWVRMRLRSILRKRTRRKGRGRGRDHQRWPNAYFTELGLFSLTAAHAEACQSSWR